MTIKHALRASSAVALIASTLGPMSAAVAQEAEDSKKLDVVVVTGSIIAGTPEDAALPVDVLSEEELSKLGSPSPVELIKQLSVSNGVIGDSNQFDAASQGAEGIASVNLRGLGPSRTLVLLNNRRLVQAGNGVPNVDINMIPAAALSRIEILKDGAAAIYGSDAIGGVVNFITRNNQEGFIVDAEYEFIDGSDGNYGFSGSYGKQGDNYSLLLAAGYQERGELLANERDWAIRPYEDNPQGGWTGGGLPTSYVPLGAAGPLAGLTTDAACEEFGGFIDGRCRVQYTPFDALTDKETRHQLYGQFDIDFTDTVRGDLSVLYGYSEVPHYRTSPTYLQTRAPSPAVGGSPSGFVVPGTNPGFAAYLAENPGALPAGTEAVLIPNLVFRPALAGGNPRYYDNNELGSAIGYRESETFRISGGLEFDIGDNHTASFNLTHHKYDRHISSPDTFTNRVQLALAGLGGEDCEGVAGAGNCLWLNPFSSALEIDANGNIRNTNSAEVFEWISGEAASSNRTDLTVLEANFGGGTGFELPGGEVLFGIGAQYRDGTFESENAPDSNLATTPCPLTPVNGDTSCSNPSGALAFLGTNADSYSEGDVYALFTELQFPFTNDLNVQLAARFEDYGGSTGSTFDPKLSARWQATDNIGFRGSVGTTFRGPSSVLLSERNLTSLQFILGSFRPVDVSGNPNLQPETAVNYSAGVLFEGGGFKGSLDYWRYELEDTLISDPVGGLVDTLFPDGATCATTPEALAVQDRFQFTNDVCGVATLERIQTFWQNGPEITTDGLDLLLSYERDIGEGVLGLGTTVSYIMSYDTAAASVNGVVVQDAFEAVGSLNNQSTAYPLPEWKGQFYVEYQLGDFDTRLTVNHIDSYEDQRFTGQPGGTIDAQTLLNLNARYYVTDTTLVSLSVSNLLDEDPSFARLDYNYDPFTGNAVGRAIKVGVKHEF